MNLSRPMFLISGLPEHGEVLADAVISNLIQQEFLSSHIGFAFMGSHTMKKYARDRSLFGWGRFIAQDITYMFWISLPYRRCGPTSNPSIHRLSFAALVKTLGFLKTKTLNSHTRRSSRFYSRSTIFKSNTVPYQ